MSGYLTTHVLDTGAGCPAANLTIDLYRIEGDARTHLRSMVTNGDGRTDSPILPQDEFATGDYELIFRTGPYLITNGATDDFLPEVPVRFRMVEPSHYHVPLLLSPFGYSTYRGS
ncbi:MAG: hydroxyisourate hydrolase [Pikeienuella sp.]